MPWLLTPPPNEQQELENICKQIEHTPINIRKSKDNLMNLREGLELLLEKVNTNKIIVKSANKRSIIVVMTPRIIGRCAIGIFQIQPFIKIQIITTRLLLFKTVNKFAEIKSILTNNEFDFLTKRCHKTSNFYMLPKLHKSKEINEIIEIKRTEYI